MILNFIFQAVLFVASVAYQRAKAKKLQKELDKQKGIDIVADGEVFDLAVCYGRTKISGGRTYHKLANSYVHAGPASPPNNSRTPAAGYTYIPGDTYIHIVGSNIFIDLLNAFALLFRMRTIKAEVSVYIGGTRVYYNRNYYGSLTTIIAPNGRAYFRAPEPSVQNINSGEWGVASYDYGQPVFEFSYGLNSNIGGEKNEFLFVQQALCYGGIDAFIWVDVDSKNYNDGDYSFGQRIHAYGGGNVADAMATANGIPSTNRFTNTAYASMCFRLNREDYNYSGVPNVEFYIRGMRVRSIVDNLDGTYYLSAEKAYSNNPALCLLDYLTNPIYGAGLQEEQIDLASFEAARVLCNRIVRYNAPFSGKYNGVRGPGQTGLTRNIKLYECNIALDSGKSIRENVELILSCMTDAELVWSGGKYKLILTDPLSAQDQDDITVLTVTPDTVVRDKEIKLTWPNSSQRLNQCVIRYKNESEDFVDDTAIWPPTYSDVHRQYLLEDSGKILKEEYTVPGISTEYHARARAEQEVRKSRNGAVLDITLTEAAIVLEPGDIIRLSDEIKEIYTNLTLPSDYEHFKVEEVKINPDLTVKIKAVQYFYGDLAWNAPDNIAYIPREYPDFSLAPPTNLAFTVSDGSSVFNGAAGRLTWDAADDVAVERYSVEASINDGISYIFLGYTTDLFFDITGLVGREYQFYVRSISYNNMKSTRVPIGPYTIESTAVERIAIIYADDDDETTNNQSFNVSNTNLLLYSEDLSHATWSKTGVTISADITTAPDTTTTADKLVEDNSTGAHAIAQDLILPAAANGVFSFYAKAAERDTFRVQFTGTGQTTIEEVEFDLTAETATVITPTAEATITADVDGWYRCTVSAPWEATTASPTILLSDGTGTSYTGDGTSGLYVWGAQLEAANSASMYIATTDSAVTLSREYVAYYLYPDGEPPTLPIRTGITFNRFKGADGAQGEDGQRGATWFEYNAGSVDVSALSTASVNAFLWNEYGLLPVTNDRFYFTTTHISGSTAYVYDGVDWNVQSAFINGNLLVNGTVNANKLVAGTITADRINTSSFSSSGLSVFGGSLQSSNYSSGSTGWRIGNGGAAEFWNLIVRGHIQSGAVSDTGASTFYNPVTIQRDGAGIAGITTPTIYAGQSYYLFAWITARRASNYWPVVRFEVQDTVGGVTSAWRTLDTQNFSGASTISYDMGYGYGFLTSGGTTTTRIRVYASLSGTSVPSSVNNLVSVVTVGYQRITR